MQIPTVARRDWRIPNRRRVSALKTRLRMVYGPPVAPPHGAPLDELILTVLSQSTSDRNRDVAFLRLRERFEDWAAVRDAPRQAVEDAIQPGGLHRQKSARIQEILRALDGDDLTGLRDVPVDTHVSRVGTRLGLFRAGAPFTELHDDMLAFCPPGQELELHVNLLRHGRRTCHAQRPRCGECALRRSCPWTRAAGTA